MATEEKTFPEVDQFGDKIEWIATLVRGHRYTLGTNIETSQMFEEGIEYGVSTKLKEKLQKRAIDTVSIGPAEDGEQEERQKFRFRKVGTPAPAPRQAGPRVRSRVQRED